jgi:hypothetical protein
LTTPPPTDAAPAKLPPKLPKILASSVVRGAHLGESHGGLYLVDLEAASAELKLDWTRTDIDFEGRGGDRGLRGIAFHGDLILVAANAELLILDRSFRVLESHRNPCLGHCHEISVDGSRVFLASTGFDSILSFDLESRRFAGGWHVRLEGREIVLRSFDPNTAGPSPVNLFHLNSIVARAPEVFFCGLYTPGLMRSDGRTLGMRARLPEGTHNAQPMEQGVVYNDTASDRICFESAGTRAIMAVPVYERGEIANIERYTSEVARPGFARGLCALGPGLIAAGSSPSTVSAYELRSGRRLRQVALSMDVRNAIHGLARWPFD